MKFLPVVNNGYNCFECNEEFGRSYSLNCHYARLHDEKRGVCRCGYDLFSLICIKNGCSKSMSKTKVGDEITYEIIDLFKDVVKDRTHKFDEDEDRDEDEGYLFNNNKEVRREPRKLLINVRLLNI